MAEMTNHSASRKLYESFKCFYAIVLVKTKLCSSFGKPVSLRSEDTHPPEILDKARRNPCFLLKG